MTSPARARMLNLSRLDNMVKAKNPGIGQGRGGGRPRREGERVKVAGLDLSPRAAELLRAAAQAGKVPAWQVVEQAIFAMEGVSVEMTPPAQPLPPEAQEIAQECAAFLVAQVDRPAAVKALRRAWKQALAMVRRALA